VGTDPLARGASGKRLFVKLLNQALRDDGGRGRGKEDAGLFGMRLAEFKLR
jgi:hypothetical protein